MARRSSVCNNAAMAVAMAAALMLLALLSAAGEAEETCNVDQTTVMRRCMSSCSSGGTPSKRCCDALRHADFRCLCRNYWEKLRKTPYASCATIPSKCNIPGAPTSC